MKGSTIHLMLASALLVVATTVASAQTNLKADIPFPFRANGVVMAPGRYVVKPGGISPVFTLRGADTNAFVQQNYTEDPPPAWKASPTPRLEFVCGDAGCVLNRIWTAAGAPVHRMVIPKDNELEPSTRLVALTAK